MDQDVSPQIQILETILNEETTPELRKRYREYFNSLYHRSHPLTQEELDDKFFVRKNSPHLWKLGRSSVVLRLDENYLAKSVSYGSWQDYWIASEGRKFGPWALQTIQLVNQELGLNTAAALAKATYQHGKVHVSQEDYGSFMVMPDFSENGRYQIRDIGPQEDFSRFSNGEEVQRTIEAYLDRLLAIYDQIKSGKLPEMKAAFDGHTEIDGPRGSFRRIFYLKIDPAANIAEVVAGDFNHAVLCKAEK